MHGDAIGGTETQLWSLFEHLSQFNELLLACPPGNTRDFLKENCEAVHSPPNTIGEWDHFLRQQNPKLVFTVQGKIFSLAAASRRRNVPVLWICGFPPAVEEDSDSRALAASLFDRIIAPSSYVRSHLSSYFSNVQVIRCGIDTQRFRPRTKRLAKRIRHCLGLSEQDFVVGYAGRLTHYKRHVDLIKTLALLKKKIPNSRLLLVGGSHATQSLKLWSDLKRAIRQYQLSSDVVCINGDPESMPGLLSAMDVFASPAEGEGLGCATLEAMATEKPVVLTNSGGPTEILRKNEGGFLVPVGDCEALAEKITFLFRHPEQSERLGKAARAIVQSDFPLAQMTKHYQNLLAEFEN